MHHWTTIGDTMAAMDGARGILVPALRRLRKARGPYTQAALASLAGVGRNTVVRGENKLPIDAGSVQALAKALGVETTDLMGEA